MTVDERVWNGYSQRAKGRACNDLVPSSLCYCYLIAISDSNAALDSLLDSLYGHRFSTLATERW